MLPKKNRYEFLNRGIFFLHVNLKLGKLVRMRSKKKVGWQAAKWEICSYAMS